VTTATRTVRSPGDQKRLTIFRGKANFNNLEAGKNLEKQDLWIDVPTYSTTTGSRWVDVKPPGPFRLLERRDGWGLSGLGINVLTERELDLDQRRAAIGKGWLRKKTTKTLRRPHE